jgi:hypothetical protein
MNRILYKSRCRCNEEFSINKKPKKQKVSTRREGRPLPYPKPNEGILKTFQIRYDKKLSPTAKFILNSFQNKYIYYAIDDILYSFKSNPTERENLLAILYSPVLSLQNNFSINFFDIWIHEIYIHEIPKINKFFKNDFSNFEQFNYITIKLWYKIRTPAKKLDSLW